MTPDVKQSVCHFICLSLFVCLTAGGVPWISLVGLMCLLKAFFPKTVSENARGHGFDPIVKILGLNGCFYDSKLGHMGLTCRSTRSIPRLFKSSYCKLIKLKELHKTV